MKVVALISGGKDSCYSALLAQRHGHEVVALANLLPVDAATDELDSYMYQTVGHQVAAAYAACTGLPLFRRRILGQSKNQGLVYQDTAGDEVEDLAALLAFVQAALPGVQAVSCGAIASDYQRTRVERVCARLGLVSLAFMWNQPQARLLRDMIQAPVHAVLVKVAAAGLRPDRHLGAPLAALAPALHALRRRFGINVCGEGGEYETLTLDCPLFTRGRLVLDAWQAVVTSNDAVAPVALLHPTAFHVEPKGRSSAEAGAGAGEVIEVPDDYQPPAAAGGSAQDDAALDAAAAATAVDVELRVAGGGACLSVAASVAGDAADFGSPGGTAAAMAAALRAVDGALPGLGVGWGDSLFVHLYVPSMAQFAAANAAYARFLPAVNPPARATVQLAGGGGAAMVVEVLLGRPAAGAQRRVLHVQSISSWAPSCIGPYSQALAHRGAVHFAGQIPLDPGTMAVAGAGDAAAQCARALASCAAVAVAMRTHLPRSMLWATVYCSEEAGAAGLQEAGRAVAAFLAGGGGLGAEEELGDEDEDEHGEEEGLHDDDVLDDYLLPPAMARHWAPQLTFVAVPHLPRGVLVEIQPTAWAEDAAAPEPSSSSSSDEDAAPRAPPPGPSMPRWVRAVEHSTSACEVAGAAVRVHTLVSLERFARVQAAVEPAKPATPEQMAAAAAGAAELLLCELHAAGFAAGDLAAAKIYCSPAAHATAGAMRALSAAVGKALGGSATPVAVPVSAVGADAAVSAAVVLELYAVK